MGGNAMSGEVAAKPVSGQFWLPTGGDRLPGRLELSGDWPRLLVAGQLQSAYRIEESKDGATTTRRYAAEVELAELVIHGQVGGVGPVTLVDAAMQRSTTQIPSGQTEQSFEVKYAVLGAHVDSSAALYDRARFKLSCGTRWAALGGLEVQISTGAESRSDIVLSYSEPSPVDIPLSGSTTMRIRLEATLPVVTVGGANFMTAAVFDCNFGPPGRTYDEVVTEVLNPLVTLMTLLHDEECVAQELLLHDPSSDRWLTVRSSMIRVGAPDSEAVPLLSLPQLEPSHLRSWLERFPTWSPLPQVVSAAVTDRTRAVENRVLELATAAEGLHRRLHADVRRLTVDEVARDLVALSDSGLSVSGERVLQDALRTYLWQPSLPQRLQTLINETLPAAPGVVGRSKRWISAICAARNGFAHFLPGVGTTSSDEAISYSVLADSLRWLLTARLFLDAGIQPSAIQAALDAYKPYTSFRSRAARALPKLYG
jgi:hypothetical protein